ncbi:MAG: hypothetical protein GXP14_13305 [Gammaproteobacteria bacterium]|nr:hypothetical protein [Gammaproteobacteria bacterium]
MEVTRMSVNGAQQHMDINIACCITYPSNTNIAYFFAKIRDYLSENIKFWLVRFFGYASQNNALKLKHNHCSSQADLTLHPSISMRFDTGNSNFPDTHLNNFLRAIPKPFDWAFESHNNDLLRKL